MKKILGCLLILALAVTCINIPVKADEPTGMWVLTGHRENIKEAVNDEYWQYELGYDYNESKGKVIYSKLIKLTNIDGHFESTFIAECTIPKATVKPGEYLQVDVNTYVEGSNLTFNNVTSLGLVLINNKF